DGPSHKGAPVPPNFWAAPKGYWFERFSPLSNGQKKRGAPGSRQVPWSRATCGADFERADQRPLDIAYCGAGGEGGCAAGAGMDPGRTPGANGSGSPKLPPGRPPKPKNRRGGLQKLSPRSARFEINSSVIVTSTTGCLALAQNFFTACRV